MDRHAARHQEDGRQPKLMKVKPVLNIHVRTSKRNDNNKTYNLKLNYEQARCTTSKRRTAPRLFLAPWAARHQQDGRQPRLETDGNLS